MQIGNTIAELVLEVPLFRRNTAFICCCTWWLLTSNCAVDSFNKFVEVAHYNFKGVNWILIQGTAQKLFEYIPRKAENPTSCLGPSKSHPSETEKMNIQYFFLFEPLDILLIHFIFPTIFWEPNVDSVNSLICILWLALKWAPGQLYGLGLRNSGAPSTSHPSIIQNFTVSPRDPQIWDRVKQQKRRSVLRGRKPVSVCWSRLLLWGTWGQTEVEDCARRGKERHRSLKGKIM